MHCPIPPARRKEAAAPAAAAAAAAVALAAAAAVATVTAAKRFGQSRDRRCQRRKLLHFPRRRRPSEAAVGVEIAGAIIVFFSRYRVDAPAVPSRNRLRRYKIKR
ncbi:hypothetical protein ACS0PU_005192 [Formica fusca]